MRSSAPPLLPIFRSDLQGRLLALLFANPERDHTVSELARRLDAPVSTVQREVDRLAGAELLATRHIGRARLVRADLDSPYGRELGALVLKAYGPTHVMAKELRGIEGIDEAYIYGSWAARARGVAGPAPRDVDVLVVGTPDPDEVHRAATAAQRELGVEVSVIVRTPGSWRDQDDGFVRTVREGHLVPVELDGE